MAWCVMLIGEIARMSGLSKDGVRHYEEMGLIASTPRRAGSRKYRDYDLSVLQRIEKVRAAQRLGYTLKDIGPLLEVYVDRPSSKEDGIAFLERRLVVIREKITALQTVEAFICRKLQQVRDPLPGLESARNCSIDDV